MSWVLFDSKLPIENQHYHFLSYDQGCMSLAEVLLLEPDFYQLIASAILGRHTPGSFVETIGNHDANKVWVYGMSDWIKWKSRSAVIT